MSKYLFLETIKGVLRHKKASVSVMLLSAMSFFFLGLTGYVGDLVNQTTQYLHGQMTVRVLFDTEKSRTKIEEMILREHETENLTYLSKETMRKELTDTLREQQDVLDMIEKEYYPSGISFTLQKETPSTDRLLQGIKQLEGVKTVIYPKELAQTIHHHISMWKKGLWVMTGVSLFTTLFVISLSLQLAISKREDEIQVKYLLGAHPWVIKGQFFLETLCLVMIGSILALVGLWLMNAGYHRVITAFSFLQPTSSLPLVLSGWVFIAAFLTGILGSLVPIAQVIEKKQ